MSQRGTARRTCAGPLTVTPSGTLDTDEGLRTVPGRIMSGIQFFEAQIDDQLLPRAFYDDLLARHGFSAIGSVTLTPMHALTYGRVPQ